MSVVVETTLGDITIDLYIKERPRACLNFLKLCKIKYYNFSLFHTVSRDFIAQTGDPTGSRKGGESIHGVLEGPLKRYFECETNPRIKHTITGLVSFVGIEENMIGSQFFITLAPDLTYLDDKHCVFGEVAEGLEIIELFNEAICDTDSRPYQDIRITHTVILDDPFPDLNRLRIPARSPSPSAERLQGGRIAPDEEIDETVGKSVEEIEEVKAEREAKARATILEMVGDIPDADMAPPENVLFVCKLNPVTTDDDLEIIFSRFGTIKSCEVIRDRKTGDSLQYAFIEFEEEKSCEDAYFKMDNVLIDDRRIHVDFSQSVAKVKWLGKGRGVAHFDGKGRRIDDKKNDIGKGNYTSTKDVESSDRWPNKKSKKNEDVKDRSKDKDRYFDKKKNMREDHYEDGRGKDKDKYNDMREDRYEDGRGKEKDKYNDKKEDRYEDRRSKEKYNDRKEYRYENRKSYADRTDNHYEERRDKYKSHRTDRDYQSRSVKTKNKHDTYSRDYSRRNSSRKHYDDEKYRRDHSKRSYNKGEDKRESKKKAKRSRKSSSSSSSSSCSSSSSSSESSDGEKRNKQSHRVRSCKKKHQDNSSDS